MLDTGFNIPVICEKRLQLACFAARTYNLVGRGLSRDALNRDRLKSLNMITNQLLSLKILIKCLELINYLVSLRLWKPFA